MKMFKLWQILVGLLLVATGYAQPVPDSIPAGTRLRVKLENPVSTKTSRVGDGIEVRLIERVKIHEQVVLPMGTYLTGRVAMVRSADRKEHVRAALNLAFEKITLPDGRVLQSQSSIQSLGAALDVDREGVATKPDVSKGEVAEGVVTGSAVGAGIGAIAGGGKGAAIGAGAGAVLATLGAWAAASMQWEDFELKRGRKMWLRLDQDLRLASEELQTPERPRAVGESAKEAAGKTQQSEAMPTTDRQRGAVVPPVVQAEETSASRAPSRQPEGESRPTGALRVFLTDRKSWEAAGGFAQKSGTAAGAEPGNIRPPKPEILKAFGERCPTAVVTLQRDGADYIVMLDRSVWQSPPYKVAVFSRDGDAIYTGGTQLLRNAVKDACESLRPLPPKMLSQPIEPPKTQRHSEREAPQPKPNESEERPASPVGSTASQAQPVEKDKYAVRLGNLLVTATMVEIAHVFQGRAGTDRARSGQHFFLVSVTLRNIGIYPNCLDFVPILKVDYGFKIHRLSYRAPSEPKINLLPPGAEAAGSYAFAVRDDQKPVELVLDPHAAGDTSVCRGWFDPPLPAVPVEVVRIPLDGLPSPAVQR